jgi:hypothetical protein
MPIEFWNEDYDKFPSLMDQKFIKEQTYTEYDISLSPIPRSNTGCNFSCVGSNGYGSSTNEMSFHVDMSLNAPGFKYNAFPVLLASNDFDNWWLAADRRDSTPNTYFQSANAEEASVYRYVTEECTRPPDVQRDSTGAPQLDQLDPEEQYASTPTYVLVCVTWHSSKVQWHAQEDNNVMDAEDVAQQCDAVGGVCGWPCGSNQNGGELPGCSAGSIDVNLDLGTVANVQAPMANFTGDISVRACTDEPGSKECTTSSSLMSKWPCKKCQQTTKQTGQGDDLFLYDSFPRMEVLLKNTAIADEMADAVPRAYILTSPINYDGRGPAGMLNGTWKKLYDPDLPSPRPMPVSLIEKEEVPPEGETTTLAPTFNNNAYHKMHYHEKNRVTLKPSRCFGQSGPLYLVACAVNESTYTDKFEMVHGQTVAPMPFTDRCLAVSGRCAYACMDTEADLEHCVDGVIPMEKLVQDRDLQKWEVPTNSDSAVNMFVFTLLVGFAVKLVTYFPGLFVPYKHPRNYEPSMTEELKYIAVCAPSGGETKACVLRNLIGAVSTLPKSCRCPFHVIFADEGHRHPHKVMFRSLVAVLRHIPNHCVDQTVSDTGRSPRNVNRNFKEDNLKRFTKIWVEQTRMCRLDGCNTHKIADKIKKLKKELKDPSQPTDEINNLEKAMDDLAGVTALKTLQARSGWPKGDADPDIRSLEAALQQLRIELSVGEKTFDGAGTCDTKKPMHLDDCEDHSWAPAPCSTNPNPQPLYTLHYVARAKPDEDERILKVQHVARGIWYYKIPMAEDKRNKRTWREWRQSAQEFTDADFDKDKYIVPLRTSRGKAGGLNFVENYLFDYTCQSTSSVRDIPSSDGVKNFKYSLFSIADARHQYQPDFMHETIPFFFQKQTREMKEVGKQDVDTSVAFTQCPQYYPEMPDDVDYLDTNNSNFFRLNCMLRNCCGGVSSCGTGGTWLIRDRRAGIHGSDSIWDFESVEFKRQGFTQIIESTYFHESCKVEDTASSLHRVVTGKHSQYVNQRLAYGMAKDPVDYLAAVQRWAEGGVVLSLQTFFGCEQGIHMIWLTLVVWLGFVTSLYNLVFGAGYLGLLDFASQLLGGAGFYGFWEDIARSLADACIDADITIAVYRDEFTDIFLQVFGWMFAIFLAFVAIFIMTTISHYLHFSTFCLCCKRRRKLRRTRFPTSMAQWARLLITMDNLTYFLWFWTAFFWVGFNYYGVYFYRKYHFDANGMVIFSWMMQVFSWSLVISSTCRYRMDQSMAANEVFFLSLTNIWRTTQMFYITAPLTVYSIIMGFFDFLRNRMLGVDISYWVGGDRGAVSKAMTQWWTLLLVLAMIVTNILFWANLLPNADFVGVLVVTFIGLDVMHPCAFLWLGVAKEKLPTPPASTLPAWQRCLRRVFQLLFSFAFWRNIMRGLVFHPRTALVVQWIGPLQNVLMPVLTIFYPEFGINNALLLLASVK